MLLCRLALYCGRSAEYVAEYVASCFEATADCFGVDICSLLALAVKSTARRGAAVRERTTDFLIAP